MNSTLEPLPPQVSRRARFARTAVLLVLTALPVVIYAVLGAIALWRNGWLAHSWWWLPICWLLAWVTARLWRPASLTATDAAVDPLKPERHWTPRDRDAAEVVTRFQQQVDDATPQQLVDPQFYLQQSQELARQIARVYHPRDDDPVASLTVPELLAAGRLALDDLEEWVITSIPGSRLLTVRQWRWLSRAPRWFRRARDISWAAMLLLNPANIVRYISSRYTLDPVTQELQTEILAAVYLRFIRQLGFYLIEMNSGRLRGGAEHYREVFGTETPAHASHDRGVASTSSPLPSEPLTLALVGQAKAGKSSLINALLGEHRAEIDVLPKTSDVERYALDLGEAGGVIELLDTPGYSEAGPDTRQQAAIQQAVCAADIMLLVLDAHHPAREADRRLMEELSAWYAQHAEWKPPPVIAVLTHIDLLRPASEWAPPYNWRSPSGKKEQSIHDAVGYVFEIFGDRLAAVIPVALAEQPTSADGVREDLLPALVASLPEGRAAQLLRLYYEELDRERLRELGRQALAAGRQLLQWYREERWGR